MTETINAAVLGASGYTGAETIRILAGHPKVEVAAVSANALAGQMLGHVFPHLDGLFDLALLKAEDIDWSSVDVVFGCLPHGASQDLIESLPDHVRIIDLSADYRLRDPDLYEVTYGRAHIAPDRTRAAVYGLTEHARSRLPGADIIACPGCYPTATLLALLPPVKAGLIEPSSVIIDAKSGVSGAGRGLKAGNLFSEAAEGLRPYAVGAHRHAPEIEQELSLAAGESVPVTFTPHLVPMVRGELVTCHIRGDADEIHGALSRAYQDERFVRVLPLGAPAPDTRHVRGSNTCLISVHGDRVPGRVVVVAVIDNLVKGSGGQAVQNLNAALGWDEGLGLDTLAPIFP
ncbi:MAG: N-acetyl-gamma-glutamyl-phosphate reductase [Pseudomonadota bacterium]